MPNSPTPQTGSASTVRLPGVAELLHHLGTQMHAISNEFAAREQLHQTDVQALSILAINGGRLTAGALSRELDLSSGATTRLVDRLERVGHVARENDLEDRRRRHVAITPSAAATAGAFFGQLATLVDAVLAEHPEHEREVIRRFLGSLVRAMEDRPATGPANLRSSGAPPRAPRRAPGPASS